MRAFALLAMLLLATLAGCSDRNGGGREPVDRPDPLVADDITVPEGAVLTDTDSGFDLVWAAHALPFTVDVTVPEHATMIRAVAESGASSVSMSQLETGRRRCNNPTVEDFSSSFTYPKSCSSVAALDVPGTQWHVTFGGSGTGDLRVEFRDTPLDGLLADIDVAGIDPPTRDLQDTVVEFIPSHDGILLRTERTLPQGDGPFPTILVSSPYYDDGIRATPADWTYVVQDWAKRGYAMVTADVRGFGDSGGCVEVWGRNEQLDQKVLVEWVAAQPWSDGNVGFYGQSYVGTTPVEAAVQAPEALKAIVTIAPVINAYEDWHYGGVPNGENELSPVAYQVLTDAFTTDPTLVLDERFQEDPQQMVNNAINGPCDATLMARANDPRGIYNDFYLERDFKVRAKDVKAAVLYTEGFEDANVKSAMIPTWFNDLQSPKLGLFGHWLHQHPSRLDCEALFLGWFETHLKGKNLGFDALPNAAIVVDRETERYAEQWPDPSATATSFGLKFDPQRATGTLVQGVAGSGLGGFGLLPVAGAASSALVEDNAQAVLTGQLVAPVSLAGVATLHLEGGFYGTGTGYVGAELWDGDRLVTWGQYNLAHDPSHTTYTPRTWGEAVTVDLPMLPTEHIFPAGATLRLVVYGVDASEATDPFGSGGQAFEIDGAGTALLLPGAPLDAYHAIPLTARP